MLCMAECSVKKKMKEMEGLTVLTSQFAVELNPDN